MKILWIGALIQLAAARYSTGNTVEVSMNKVWPRDNPQETYRYYDALPVCQPEHTMSKRMTFGQILRGDRLVNSLYKIGYLINGSSLKLCERRVDTSDVDSMRRAIEEQYIFEAFVDDLPVTAFVGEMANEKGVDKYYLATSFTFELGYNDGEVVSASLVPTKTVNIAELAIAGTVEFLYSVNWVPSNIPKYDRLKQQLVGALPKTRHRLDIHWVSIINSFVLVLFITSLLLLIVLRVVRSDLSKYLRIPDEELTAGVEEESGWKLLHFDVFRAPPHRMWFCACVGSGAQLFLVCSFLVAFGVAFPYMERGALLSAALFGYLLTSFISGYISANLYTRLGGVKWAWNVIVTTGMFIGPLFIIWSILNSIAIFSGSTAALPFKSAMAIFLCWLLVTVPLTIIGGIAGRHAAREKKLPFPCKANRLPRQIPSVRWYQSPWLQVALAGFLPFSAMYIELHFIMASVWGMKSYTLYGVLMVALVMLMLVAVTLSILLTYFHLNSEDHRWWWRSFVAGGSVAFYFLLHSLYYFAHNTQMSGILQVAFFFGYSFLIAHAIFLMLGFLSFVSTYNFVVYIYSRSRSE